MFALSAEQVDGRSTDVAQQHLDLLAQFGGERLVLPPDRSEHDTIEAATDDPATALGLVLHLSRGGSWRVGLGIGEGSALTLARDAVTRSRRRPTRFAVGVEEGRLPDAALLEPLLDLVLHLRARRTVEGWQLYDLLRTGITQSQAAARLGVTPQAVSLRARSAQLRTEFAAHDALVRLLDAAGSPG